MLLTVTNMIQNMVIIHSVIFSDGFRLLYGLLAILVITFLGLLVFLIINHERKKNHSNSLDTMSQCSDAEGSGTVTRYGGQHSTYRGKLRIVLTNLENQQQYLAGISDSIIAGRGGNNTQLIIPDDSFISEEHMIFSWKNGIVILSDNNSKNGTAVNGTKITGPIVLNQNDIIVAGKTAMKVNWMFA